MCNCQKWVNILVHNQPSTQVNYTKNARVTEYLFIYFSTDIDNSKYSSMLYCYLLEI